MSSKPISNLNKLDDILDTDSLVIIKQGRLYKIPFSKFKLPCTSFFTACSTLNEATNRINILKNYSLRNITSVETLSSTADLRVDTNAYFIGDESVEYDDTRLFAYSTSLSCFASLDTIDHIKPEWFDIRPGSSSNHSNIQNLIDLTSTINTCNSYLKLMSDSEDTIKKPIIFSPGPYTLDNTLTIPSNISIQGENTFFQIDDNVTTGVMITGNNVSIDNIKFVTNQSHMYMCNCYNANITN